MAYHGSLRRGAEEVETDRKNLASWVEQQRQAGIAIPSWKLARLQGYEDALVSLGGAATARPKASRDGAAASGPADEIRRDYLKFARKSDAELLSQYGHGGPGDSGEQIRRAAIRNLVDAYARMTGTSPADAEKALADYADRSGA